MGVNNENEPVSGTGPDKRLFDKSLQSYCKKILSSQSIKIFLWEEATTNEKEKTQNYNKGEQFH